MQETSVVDHTPDHDLSVKLSIDWNASTSDMIRYLSWLPLHNVYENKVEKIKRVSDISNVGIWFFIKESD